MALARSTSLSADIAEYKKTNRRRTVPLRARISRKSDTRFAVAMRREADATLIAVITDPRHFAAQQNYSEPGFEDLVSVNEG